MSSRTKQRWERRGGGCAGPVLVERDGNLAAIVRAYETRHRARSREELASFTAEPTLDSAVRRAGLAQRPDGKRYDHQRRVPLAVLQEATYQLEHARLDRAADFEELHRLVDKAIGSIRGVGELTVYDTALRIGAKLGVTPQRVYLHSGTREGARALGLDWRMAHLTVAQCAQELRRLEPHEIEDCLCIFKGRLGISRPRVAHLMPRSQTRRV